MGTRLVAGAPDQADPKCTLNYEDISIYSERFAEFSEFCGIQAITASFTDIARNLRPRKLWKPRRLVGGLAIQREEVALNSFGATISADFTQIFNPLSAADRANIARNGYIPSKRRERYIAPIDRVIRAAAPPSETSARTLDDTGSPKELVKVLRDRRPLEQKVLLIIGSAGSGKTTFVDYLQEVALPQDIRAKTIWLRIDMNPAPISRNEIYDWLRLQIVRNLEAAHPKLDFDDLATLQSIYASEINSFRKGVGRLFEKDPTVHAVKLGEFIQGISSDIKQKANSYTRYFSLTGNKLVIFVLDNLDKRLRDEQLLMFEAAQWLLQEYRGLVVLPLREETYDNHRNEKTVRHGIERSRFPHRAAALSKGSSEQGSACATQHRKKGSEKPFDTIFRTECKSSTPRRIRPTTWLLSCAPSSSTISK